MAKLLFSYLHGNSLKAFYRLKRKWGRPYEYKPRGRLLERLSKETGLSVDAVYVKLCNERHQLIEKYLTKD